MFEVYSVLWFCLYDNQSKAFGYLKKQYLFLKQLMPVLRKPGIHRTALRQTFERNGHISTVQPALSFTVPSISHKPIPSLPIMQILHFELILLAYLLTAMLIQYINIYKANMYVIDYHLLMFITIILLRRVAWILLKQTLASEVVHTITYWFRVCMKAFLLLLMFCLCLLSLYNVIQSSAIEDVLFLCYPFGVYLWTFGCTLNPYSHSVLFKLGSHQSKLVQELIVNNASLFHQAVTLQIPLCSSQVTSRSPAANPSSKLSNGLVYNTEQQSSCSEKCSMSPDSVRYEAECLRTDFNLRMKQILFNALVSTYYVAFIPIKFTQNGWLFFDWWWSIQHVFFVLMNVFVLLMNFLVPHHYIDGLHKCALHLGGWKKYNGQRETPHVWSPLTVWPQAALVRHSKGLFRAVDKQNTAVPGDTHHARFYFIFKSPLRLLNWLSIIQLTTVIYQLYVMACSSAWYQCLSIVPMSVFSHLLLFRLLRERWAVQATLEEHLLCTGLG